MTKQDVLAILNVIVDELSGHVPPSTGDSQNALARLRRLVSDLETSSLGEAKKSVFLFLGDLVINASAIEALIPRQIPAEPGAAEVFFRGGGSRLLCAEHAEAVRAHFRKDS